MGRRIDTLQRDCLFHGDRRPRFFSRSSRTYGRIFGPRGEYCRWPSRGARDRLSPGRRGVALEPRKSESCVRPFVYSWRFFRDDLSRRFRGLPPRSRSDFLAGQLTCDTCSLVSAKSSRSGGRESRYRAKYFSRAAKRESQKRAVNERTRRSAPCIRVLTQSLSRNFSGRQGRIYPYRYPVPSLSASNRVRFFSTSRIFRPLPSFSLPLSCFLFASTKHASRLLTRYVSTSTCSILKYFFKQDLTFYIILIFI